MLVFVGYQFTPPSIQFGYVDLIEEGFAVHLLGLVVLCFEPRLEHAYCVVCQLEPMIPAQESFAVIVNQHDDSPEVHQRSRGFFERLTLAFAEHAFAINALTKL